MSLDSHLAVLQATDPGLAARLAVPAPHHHLGSAEQGTTWRAHRSLLLLSLSPQQVSRTLMPLAGADTVLVLGIGDGELVDAALGRGLTVQAWDRDPALVRAWLGRSTHEQALQTGRLRLLLGTDLLQVPVGSVAECTHPVLGQPYRYELQAWRDQLGPRAMVCLGGLLTAEIATMLGDTGFAVWPLDHERLHPRELDHTLSTWNPSLVVTVNHVRGLSQACARVGARLWVWEIDPSLEHLRPEPGNHDHVLLSTWREQQVQQWRDAGFSHAESLPLAAPAHRRPVVLEPEELALYDAPVAFVGASLVDNVPRCRSLLVDALSRFLGNVQRARAVIEDVLQAQRSDFSTFRVPALLDYHAPDFVPWMARRSTVDPVQLLGELAACEKRLNTVAALAPLGVHVWGDRGWQVLRAHGVDVRGPIGHRHALTRLYSAVPLQLDVGRIYQSDIVTLRVFEAAACGACVLTEPSSALVELFEPGEELLTWRDASELQALVAHYVAHPEQARAIGERARARVEREHRLRLRVQHALDTLGLAEREQGPQGTQRRSREPVEA